MGALFLPIDTLLSTIKKYKLFGSIISNQIYKMFIYIVQRISIYSVTDYLNSFDLSVISPMYTDMGEVPLMLMVCYPVIVCLLFYFNVMVFI